MSYCSTFADVERLYNNIKPVISVYHDKASDIRPIENRRYKERRIMKVSKNCYAFLVNFTGMDGEFKGRQRVLSDVPTLADVLLEAPIVWRKHKDGSETVTIHNAKIPYSTCWYEFLRRHLPAGLVFSNAWGKPHTVWSKTGEYFIPHNKFSPRSRGDNYRYYASRNSLGATPKFERSLTFRRDADAAYTWALISEPYAQDRKSTHYIDKAAKAAIAPQLKELKQWMLTMYPIIETPRSAYNQEIQAQVREAISETKQLIGSDADNISQYSGATWWHRPHNATLARHALENTDSPMRVPMLISFKLYVRENNWGLDDEQINDPKLMQSRLNNFCNRALGLKKKVGE